MDDELDNFLEKRRTININQALERVDEQSWDRIKILIFDIFRLQWKIEYETKEYNKGYSEFKCFMQDKSYESFTLYFFCYYILQLLYDCHPTYLASKNVYHFNQYLPYLQHGVLQPILILFLTLTKNKQCERLSQTSNYLIQNLQICLISIYLSYLDVGTGIRFISATALVALSVESLTFKIITILSLTIPQCSMLNLVPLGRSYLVIQNCLIGLAIVVSLVYSEMCRYASFFVEFQQIKANKDNMKKILGFILQSQSYEQNCTYYQNIMDKVDEQDENHKTKIDIHRALNQYFDDDDKDDIE